jgi:HEAT repeat protein
MSDTPWDASMPLREDMNMNYNDLVARWTEMSGSMSKADAAILFASAMTRADNTAIRDELARLRAAQTPEITEEAVERAARGLLKHESPNGPWELQSAEQHERWRAKARAALAAAWQGENDAPR